jgi:hypothetical protein
VVDFCYSFSSFRAVPSMRTNVGSEASNSCMRLSLQDPLLRVPSHIDDPPMLDEKTKDLDIMVRLSKQR